MSNGKIITIDIRHTAVVYTLKNHIKRTINKNPFSVRTKKKILESFDDLSRVGKGHWIFEEDWYFTYKVAENE